MNKPTQKILKFLKEVVVFVTLASIVLSFVNMFNVPNTAYGAAENQTQFSQEQILIAQAKTPGAAITGTPPTSTPKTGGGDVTPKPGGTTPTDSKGIIPLGTQGYSDLWQLKQTSKGPVGMLYEFVGGAFRNAKYILGAVAILFVIIAAIKLIMAGDNEEIVRKQKLAITYAIIALAVIGFSDELAKVLSVACPEGSVECTKGGFLSDPTAIIQQSSIFNREVKIFITFIKYLIGGIAVLMLVRNGIRFVALAGAEESVTLDKKNVAFTSIGLVLIIIASTVIDKVFYIVDTERYPTVEGVQPAINPERGIEEIAGATNLVVTFASPIAILVLIVGAVMYATAGGDEERLKKAKKIIIMAVIGLILIYGAFAVISTVISGQFIA
jgi:hypothetical protein